MIFTLVLTLLLSRRRKAVAIELRLFWFLSDLLENNELNANELRRDGLGGGNFAFTLLLFSVSSSSACSSISTNDGIETLAQSFLNRYLPLSMMLMVEEFLGFFSRYLSVFPFLFFRFVKIRKCFQLKKIGNFRNEIGESNSLI